MLTKRRTSFVITLLLTLIFLLCFYAKVIFSPNDFLFSIDVDGLNNYYSYAYHIKHDTNYFLFRGMQYPFGEYWHFVDCNPALANLVKWVSEHVVDISPYSIGILNSLMLGSIVLGAGLLFLILQHFKIPPLPSMLGGIGIALLSSQSILWAYGHWALTYTCFFPTGWYLLIRTFDSSRPWLWSLLSGINILIWLFIHNYLGVILILFTLFSIVLRKASLVSKTAHLTIQIGLPILMVLTMISSFDQYGGRFDWPFVTEFRSSFWSVFYPNQSDLKPLFDGLLTGFGLSPPTPENQPWMLVGTYIGIPAIISMGGITTWIIYLFAKKNRGKLTIFVNHEMFTYGMGALLLLLFSMAIPFRFIGTTLLDHIPFIRQFIGLGRFAWAFYYVVTVASFLAISTLIPEPLSKSILFLAAGCMIFESLGTHRINSKQIMQFPNFFEDDRSGKSHLFETKIDSIDFEQYQAIIPLPFYYKWNTPFDFGSTAKAEQLSLRFSYYSGLPLVGTFLARPSLTLGHEIIQLFSPTHTTQNVIQQSLPNDKPLLVIWSKDPLSPIENELLQKGKLLSDNDVYTLASLTLENIFATDRDSLIADFHRMKDSGFHDLKSNYFYLDSAVTFYYDGYENQPNAINFRGLGAFESEKSTTFTLYQSLPNTLVPNVDYSVSFWFYNKGNMHAYCNMWIEEITPRGSIVQSFQFQPFASKVFDKNWAYNHYVFRLSNSKNMLRLMFSGNAVLDNRILIDELLIRPAEIDLYKILGSQNGETLFIKNNLNLWIE